MQVLLAEFGRDTVLAAVAAVLDGAERQSRACIATWKDGVYYGESVIDDDGHGRIDIHVRAKVTKQGSDLIVDLSETDAQTTGFINSSYANTRSAVAMALAFLIEPDTPKNAGTFRPLTVLAKQGTLVWPNPPAPTTMCTSHSGQDIAEAIMKAIIPACPERAIAGWGRRFRIALQGTDPRSGRQFIWHMFQARPGGGASVAGDGWPCGGEMQCAASVKFGSLELTEVRFPLFFRRHEFRPDSAGDGKHRGAVGTVLELQVESDGPAWANTAGDGTRHAPYGVLGGNEGLPHHYRLYTDGQYRVLKTKETMVPVHPGDVLMVEASGGGGWGNPSDRPEVVRAADVVNEFVTANGTVATPVS